MPELTPAHISILQRLADGGFAPAVFPQYPNTIGIRRGSVAALLELEEDGGLRVLTPASWMLEGNFTVRIHREGRDWYVWKSRKIEATQELQQEVAEFAKHLAELLTIAPPGRQT